LTEKRLLEIQICYGPFWIFVIYDLRNRAGQTPLSEEI